MPNPNLYGPAMEPEQHPVPEPKWPSAAASVFVWAKDQLTPASEAPPESPNFRELRAVERELAKALAEITCLNDLLEDIPEIFERKFQQRLQPLLMDRRDAMLQVGHAPGINVHARHAVTHFSQAGGSDQANVTGAKHGDEKSHRVLMEKRRGKEKAVFFSGLVFLSCGRLMEADFFVSVKFTHLFSLSRARSSESICEPRK